MAEAIKKALSVDSKLIQGGGGVFDVRVDGTLIWSKQDVGRFPEHTEILDKVKALTSG